MHYTIIKDTTFEVVEKKSKFIANLYYTENKQDAEDKIQELKKLYHDAKHNCYAYRILEKDTIYEKSSDDGEPSGTAGAPILDILQKNDLCNIIIIVTRYFGGILLGTGGLVRCYSAASAGAVTKSEISTIEYGIKLEVKLQYSEFQKLQYYCRKNDIKITDVNYEDLVTCNLEMTCSVKENFLNAIQKRELLVENTKQIEEKFIIF